MNEEGRKGGFVLKNGGASDRDAEQSAISLTANERQWTRISKKRRMGFFNPPSLPGEVLVVVQVRGEPIRNPQSAMHRAVALLEPSRSANCTEAGASIPKRPSI